MSKANFILGIFIVVALALFGVWVYWDNLDNQRQNKTAAPFSAIKKEIISFDFNDLDPKVKGVITHENHSVLLTVPHGTDVAKLKPTIEVTKGVSITPASEVEQDFSRTLVYTLKAKDGTRQDYSVKVKRAPKPPQAILSFTISGQIGQTLINQEEGTITLTVPYGANVKNLIPNIKLLPGASVDHVIAAGVDFSSPVVYKVTTADKVTQSYTVTVKVAEKPKPLPDPITDEEG